MPQRVPTACMVKTIGTRSRERRTSCRACRRAACAAHRWRRGRRGVHERCTVEEGASRAAMPEAQGPAQTALADRRRDQSETVAGKMELEIKRTGPTETSDASRGSQAPPAGAGSAVRSGRECDAMSVRADRTIDEAAGSRGLGSLARNELDAVIAVLVRHRSPIGVLHRALFQLDSGGRCPARYRARERHAEADAQDAPQGGLTRATIGRYGPAARHLCSLR